MWRVILHNDNVTCFESVIHYLQKLCSLSFDDALATTRRIHQTGSTHVAEVAGQAEAEQLAVAFQRRGIHASVGAA